jgi:hypothetical protein
MLAELAAANAAFAIIKTAVKNGGEIASAGKAMMAYFHAKEDLQIAVTKKSTGSKQNTELDEFLALEQLKKHEHDLRELMIWHGRAGLWDDWVMYQAECARQRREEKNKVEKAKAKKAKELQNIFDWIMIVLIVALGFFLLFLTINFLFGLRGKF